MLSFSDSAVAPVVLDEKVPRVTLSLFAKPRFRLVPLNVALLVTLTFEFAAFVIEPELMMLSDAACTVPSISVLSFSESAVAPVVLDENEPSITLSLFAKPRFRLVPLNEALFVMLILEFAAFVIEPALTMFSEAACTVPSMSVLSFSDNAVAPVVVDENDYYYHILGF